MVIRLAHWVAVILWYGSLSLPTGSRTRYFSVLVGLMVHSFLPYMTLLFAGTADWFMKRMVLVPLERPGMPCASRKMLCL